MLLSLSRNTPSITNVIKAVRVGSSSVHLQTSKRQFNFEFQRVQFSPTSNFKRVRRRNLYPYTRCSDVKSPNFRRQFGIVERTNFSLYKYACKCFLQEIFAIKFVGLSNVYTAK